jgi:hypothetical protein
MFEKIIQGTKVFVQGWINVALDELGVLDEATKIKAEKRLLICNACEYGGWTCRLCGCPLVAKTKSNSKCDLGKWDAVK